MKSQQNTAYQRQNLLVDKHLNNNKEKHVSAQHTVRVFCEDLAQGVDCILVGIQQLWKASSETRLSYHVRLEAASLTDARKSS